MHTDETKPPDAGTHLHVELPMSDMGSKLIKQNNYVLYLEVSSS